MTGSMVGQTLDWVKGNRNKKQDHNTRQKPEDATFYMLFSAQVCITWCNIPFPTLFTGSVRGFHFAP
jgi:hypothetical protein